MKKKQKFRNQTWGGGGKKHASSLENWSHASVLIVFHFFSQYWSAFEKANGEKIDFHGLLQSEIKISYVTSSGISRQMAVVAVILEILHVFLFPSDAWLYPPLLPFGVLNMIRHYLCILPMSISKDSNMLSMQAFEEKKAVLLSHAYLWFTNISSKKLTNGKFCFLGPREKRNFKIMSQHILTDWF